MSYLRKSAILLSDKPPAKYEINVERNVDCRSLTSNIPHFRHFCLPRPNLVQNLLETALSLKVSEIFAIFHFLCKNSRWPPKVVKIEIFRIATKDSSTTLWVQNSLQIALSLTVSEIFAIFQIPQKFKMAAKSCKI